MKKFLFLLLIASIPAWVVAQVINDPNAEARQVGSFRAISISNAFDLYLSQSDQEAVAVSASKTEYRDKIKTVVENGVLKIYIDNNNNWWKNMGNKKLKAYVSFKTLDKLSASGACDVYVNGGIKADDLVLHFSGASDFKKGEIYAKSLTVDISGASDVSLNGGKVTNLKVEASGASDFSGYDLETENCSAEASGASDIKITVNKELEARASGASGVYYKGSGVIKNLKSSGASSISKRG
jgi:hypothetical protein